MYYIGVHSTSNINDGYLGSGDRITRAIRKYGKENFTREILHIFNSREEALLKEKQLVVVNENTYNICKGGGCPPSRSGCKATGKVVLKGSNRTFKQQLASCKHSSKMKSVVTHNSKSVCVFGNKYYSKSQACKQLGISKSQLETYLKSNVIFKDVNHLKEHIWNERSEKLRKIILSRS
jgi:hypothetical protein